MQVRMLLNIGVKDAPRLGLDPVKALAGDVVEVADPAGEEMIRRGWATDRLAASDPAHGRDARLNPDERRRAEAAHDAARAADKAAAEAAQKPGGTLGAHGAAPTTSANAPANNPAPPPPSAGAASTPGQPEPAKVEDKKKDGK